MDVFVTTQYSETVVQKITSKFGIYKENGSTETTNDKIYRVSHSIFMPKNLTRLPLIQLIRARV